MDAVNLGRAIEVPATTENLKSLEISAMIARNPRKRSRTNYDHLRGKRQGLEVQIQPAACPNKGKEVDIDVVSLGGDEDEEVDYGDGPIVGNIRGHVATTRFPRPIIRTAGPASGHSPSTPDHVS